MSPTRPSKLLKNSFQATPKPSTRIGRERGWPPVTRAAFDAQRGATGALLVGSPEAVAEKIRRHSESLGGISRVTFQMDNAQMNHAQLMRSIELIGMQMSPLLNN